MHADDEVESAVDDAREECGPSAAPTARGLHPAVQVGWAIGRAANALVLGVMSHVASARLLTGPAWLPPFIGLVAFGATLLFGLWHTRRLFESWRWELRPDDVVARYGVVFRTNRSIPRVRVQHVDLSSGPVERAFGLVQVSLHVAGAAGPVLTIPGVAPADAEALREALLESARVR